MAAWYYSRNLCQYVFLTFNIFLRLTIRFLLNRLLIVKYRACYLGGCFLFANIAGMACLKASAAYIRV